MTFRRYTTAEVARFMERALGLPVGELDKPIDTLEFRQSRLMELIRKRRKPEAKKP